MFWKWCPLPGPWLDAYRSRSPAGRRQERRRILDFSILERPVRCTATSGIESMSRPLFGSLPMLSGKRTVDQREHREQREQGASREPARGPQLPHVLRHACEKPEDSAQEPQYRRHPRCHTSRSPRCHVGLLSLTRRQAPHDCTLNQSRAIEVRAIAALSYADVICRPRGDDVRSTAHAQRRAGGGVPCGISRVATPMYPVSARTPRRCLPLAAEELGHSPRDAARWRPGARHLSWPPPSDSPRAMASTRTSVTAISGAYTTSSAAHTIVPFTSLVTPATLFRNVAMLSLIRIVFAVIGSAIRPSRII